MPASSEDDSEPEIVYNGYRRVDIGNSAGHTTILEEDGLVFCGYMQMQQETVHPRPPSAKPTPVIDLVSDDEDDDRRRPSAPRVSNSVSTPSSSGSSMAPHAASPGRDDGTLVSDKTSAGARRHVAAVPKHPIRPSSPSSLAKREVPSEFMLPKTAKRQKKDKQGQPPKPAPKQVTKITQKRKYTDEALNREAAEPQEPETIIISSDEEEEPVSKRSRREESYRARTSPMDEDPIPATPEEERLTLVEDSRSDDSEVDYEYAHDALNMYRRANWKKSEYPVEQALLRDDDIAITFAGMSISSDHPGEAGGSKARRRRARNSDSRTMTVPAYSDYYGEPFVWTILRALRPPRSSTDHFPALYRLRPKMNLTQAPGGVNRIIQSKGTIAVASSASGGYEDPDVGGLTAVDPYNRDGALSVWYKDKQYTLLAHRRDLVRDDSEYTHTSVTKHYTVQDIQFNPAFPNRMASGANDHTVRIWDCSLLPQPDSKPAGAQSPGQNDETRALIHTVECCCTMGKLLYKPGEPVLAMGGHDGSVYLLRDNGGDRQSPTPAPSHLRLSRRKDSETGDIAWGLGVQSDKLFASSMTKEETVFSGTHRIFDALAERVACTLRLDEAGDSIAVHPTGTTAAIATKPAKHAHSLYLFDAARLNSNAVHKIELDSFHQSVTTMRYSPDGVYLALARDDNTTDVYDTRFLSRGKLHAFTHEPGNVFAYSKDVYGVVEAQWVEGHQSRLGLVTGGCDGAVRLWDVRLASDDPDNGAPIAQCEHDLGHFSLGSIHDNEMPLVTGEMSGKVTIFDRRRGRSY